MGYRQSDYFNSLPFEEREKLAPTLNETRLNTLKAAPFSQPTAERSDGMKLHSPEQKGTN